MYSYSYKVKDYGQPVKRYCQTLELKDDKELIEEYKRLHSREHSRKVVRDGIRAAGILEMEIYLFGNKLFMIVETPLDFDWDTAMGALAAMPGQAEWEKLVEKYQICRPGASSAEKWQLMERIFYLYEDDPATGNEENV